MAGPGRGPLSGYRVVVLPGGIAAGYCTRLLSDGGAEVIRVEPPAGDPLRRWSSSGAPIAPDDDGALFQYLATGSRSVVADAATVAGHALAASLLASADAVVWSPGAGPAETFGPGGIRELNPAATVVAITPFGLEGPWAGRPATDLTLQAWSGGLGMRGDPGRPPVPVGGRFAEWLTGLEAAKVLLASRWRTLRTGEGELVDLSMLESVLLDTVMHPVTFVDVAGTPFRPNRTANLPDVHATADGYVGFMVVTGQQWLDFCAMIGRDDWLADESLLRMAVRAERRAEITDVIEAWMAERRTDEIVELANLLRIPAAPLGNGATVAGFDHLVERSAFVKNARGGFLQPDVPWVWHGADLGRSDLIGAPRLGADNAAVAGELAAQPGPRPGPAPSAATPRSGDAPLPFAGLRVADFTANWAGPVVGHFLAMLGADCIHVESAGRPDAMRFNTARRIGDPQWWEWAGLFCGTNTNKRDLTLDLAQEEGRALARRLIAGCDVVLENYSPRVMDAFGLGWDEVRAINPGIIYVRMPAFGLSGPWRDRVGYAQTMEMVSGLAWRTGFPDQPPVIPNGPCDPVAGGHATVALLLALEHRRRTGQGLLVEIPMVGGALAVAAEQVIEYSAYGALVGRLGTRAEHIAPQGLYRSGDASGDQWVALSVPSDGEWPGLCRLLDNPPWARQPELATSAGRWAAHDDIDREVAAWVSRRGAAEAVRELLAAGVPAAVVTKPHETADNEQLQARGFFEVLNHPVVGTARYGGLPARFSAGPERVQRSPSPTLGQHNRAILCAELGLTGEEFTELADQRVIGTEAAGAWSAW